MARTVNYDGVTHNFPDDFTDTDVAAALSSYAPADKSRVGAAPAKNRNRDWAKALVMAPEVLGGMAGGFVGARMGGEPGRMTGSYIGGASMAPFHQAGLTLLGEPSPAPFTMESLRDINAAGNEQLGAEATGQLFGRSVRAAGRGLMRSSIPDARGLERSFDVPNIVDVLEKQRVGAGKGLKEVFVGAEKQGSEVLEERGIESSKRLRSLLADAESKGWKTDARTITGKARQYASDLKRNTDTPGDSRAIRKLIVNFEKEHTRRVRLPILAGMPATSRRMVPASGSTSGATEVAASDLSAPARTHVQAPSRWMKTAQPADPANDAALAAAAEARGAPARFEVIPGAPESPPVMGTIRWPNPIRAEQAGVIERGAAAKAADAYEATRSGAFIPPGERNVLIYHKKIADQLRQDMAAEIPGFSEINRETQELIAAKVALGGVETVRSAAPLSWLPVLGKMATPTIARARPFVNRSGLAMTNPYLMEALKQIPRFAQYGMFPDGFGSDTTNSGGR
jgi:hypothetical protein